MIRERKDKFRVGKSKLKQDVLHIKRVSIEYVIHLFVTVRVL